jgi:STAS domain-containing protein
MLRWQTYALGGGTFADISEAGDGPIFLDMSHLSFIDPEGINGLIRGLRSLREGCLVLHGVRGEVRKALETFALHRLHRWHVILCEERAVGRCQAAQRP